MKAQDYGFAPLNDADKDRALRLLGSLTDSQRSQLVELAKFREAYHADVKDFLKRHALMVLHSKGTDEDKALDISLEGADVLLRALAKFMTLALEIGSLGELRDGMPELESARILDLDKLLDFS